MHIGFQWEKLKEWGSFEDAGVDGRTIKKKRILETLDGKVQNGFIWFKYTVKWWALVNAVMVLRTPFSAGNFLAICGTISLSKRDQFQCRSTTFAGSFVSSEQQAYQDDLVMAHYLYSNCRQSSLHASSENSISLTCDQPILDAYFDTSTVHSLLFTI